MRARVLTPIQINLRDLPAEGRDFVFTQESAELTQVLRELVGRNDYQVHIKIMPMGNSFDMRGEIQTRMDLQCSLCASEFAYPIELKVHELIVIQKPMAKGDHQGRANHAHEWQDTGPGYIQLESDTFNIAEYVHEMVALAEPIKPVGQHSCENLQDGVQRSWLSYGPETKDESIRNNPFQVLAKMKLKS